MEVSDLLARSLHLYLKGESQCPRHAADPAAHTGAGRAQTPASDRSLKLLSSPSHPIGFVKASEGRKVPAITLLLPRRYYGAS